MENIAIILLAAGLGKRMKQPQAKVLAKTDEAFLIQHVLDTASLLDPEKCVVVVGHQAGQVQKLIEDDLKQERYQFAQLEFAEQSEQLGTGHAVQSALDELKDFSGTVLILYGDVPLTKLSTLQSLLEFHSQEKNTISILSLNYNNNAYGRIIRDEADKVIKITEYEDCTAVQKSILETNSGIYAVDSAFLIPAIKELKNDNAQNEYYLTDIVEKAVKEGQTVNAINTNDIEQLQGVNTQSHLAKVNKTLLKRRITKHIEAGVKFLLPETSYVGPEVLIEAGAEIGPNSQIHGSSKISTGVILEGTNHINDSEINSDTIIKLGSKIENSSIGKNCAIGPFANIRRESEISEDCKIGNFVETKKAKLEAGVKASHLTYLGDCEVGTESNIGAGTITCNYDGVNKHQTTIGKNVFIGSNSALIAPVHIADGAFVGAGSTIRKDVPEKALAVTKAEQKIKENWRKK